LGPSSKKKKTDDVKEAKEEWRRIENDSIHASNKHKTKAEKITNNMSSWITEDKRETLCEQRRETPSRTRKNKQVVVLARPKTESAKAD